MPIHHYDYCLLRQSLSALKRDIEQLARQQGLSLEQFILAAVTEKVNGLHRLLNDPEFPTITWGPRSKWIIHTHHSEAQDCGSKPLSQQFTNGDYLPTKLQMNIMCPYPKLK